jgi:hypothetical protein
VSDEVQSADMPAIDELAARAYIPVPPRLTHHFIGPSGRCVCGLHDDGSEA